MRTKARAISPAVSTMLLIMVAIGAVATAAAHTFQSSTIAAKNIKVTIDSVSFSRARSDSDVWLFSMNLQNTGTVPVAISGSVTGMSVSQDISHNTLEPGSRGVLSYVWTVNAEAGEKYIINFVASGSDGSAKSYSTFVTADG